MISREELYDMYWQKEMSIVDIGKELNLSWNIVSHWLNKYRIKRRSRSEAQILQGSKKDFFVSEEKLRYMYYEKQLSPAGIGKELNVSADVIRHGMKKYGLKTRSRSESVSGKLHRNWKGGISPTPYCHKFNFNFKESIRNRDDFTCQRCGYIYVPGLNNKRLSIHHIHYDKPNCYPDVITLCVSCNGIVNSDRDHWEKYFEDLLRSRGLLHINIPSSIVNQKLYKP